MEQGNTPVDEGMHFFSRPQVEELANGEWRAFYPASDWSVTADSRDLVIEKLKLEDQRRHREQPGYNAATFEALRRHLIEPIPGVYAITQKEAERIRSTPDPQAEFNRIADEMDARADNP